jgi:hypothetical protein
MPVARGILRKAEADDYRLETVVLGIVESPPFRMRVKVGEEALAARAEERQVVE